MFELKKKKNRYNPIYNLSMTTMFQGRYSDKISTV